MERTQNAAIKIDSAAPRNTLLNTTIRVVDGWWLFCALIFAIKLLLLWLDPTPKLFMGDSWSYIWTALTGWIPPDRSYFYGYLLRWLAAWPHSFTPLLVTQALASGATAIAFAMICSRFFEMTNTLSFLFGLLCALDPCQLVWERYVMTETFSLIVYVLVLYWSFRYLRDCRIWQLAVVQMLSVILIGFRISYLLVVQVCTVLLPIIASARYALPASLDRAPARALKAGVLKTGLIHLVASIAMMFVMHSAYKHVNGWLSNREPAYLYNVGAHLVAVWAPVLQPSDATDPRFGELIANGEEFKIHSLRLRDAQQYGPGFLVDRWRQIERNLKERDLVTRQTAINAVRRRPLQIVGLAVKTYTGYCGVASMQSCAQKDLGYSELTDDQVKILADKFAFVTQKQLPIQPLSLLQQYFLVGWPYYFFVIVSPLIAALATLVGRHRAFACLMFVHASILMVVVTALSARACIRYVQPVSILTLLSIAICIERIVRRIKPQLASV